MPAFEIQVLLAVDHIVVAVAPGGGLIAADVRAGLGLGEREGGDRLAGGDAGAASAPLLSRAEERDRAGAQALHGEGEVGERRSSGRASRGSGRASARPARRAPRRATAWRSQPPSPSRRTSSRQAASTSSSSCSVERRDLVAAPGVADRGRASGGASSKNGQERKVRVGHSVRPRTTGFSFAAKAR